MTASVPVGNPLLAYPPEVSDYLERFARRHSAGSVLRWLDQARSLRVLVVGEAIIDEYHYCETMGKSGKEPILATRFLQAERFAGGALAVANHVAAFCGQVGILTLLGSQDGRPDPIEGFVRARLDPAVQPVFVYQDEAPTIVKRRYLESYPLQKLFEVYYLKHMEDDDPAAAALCRHLEACMPHYDVVIVTDYGHGMLGPRAAGLLCAGARFLAVNTQANADNQGFNTISKYPRAEFASLSEKELRLEVRSRRGDAGDILREVAGRLGCRSMLVTRGSQGNLVHDRRAGLTESPALSSRILDRVGAGDAVLAAAALCAAQDAPGEVLGFLGNVVGAQAVLTVGHHHSLDRDQLAEHVLALLA